MSTTRSVAVSGLVAAIIAIALIGSVVGAGLLNTKTNTVGGSGPTTQLSSGSGRLAVLMTDPPTVPDGTSHVYVTYSNLAVHISGAGNYTGWHSLNSQGQIDLMGIINLTQTIALVNIQSGTFNAMEFNISSATVTFNGVNYTADLVYQHHYLFVPIVGGITIVNGQTSAAVLDMTPTVLLLGDPTNPTFAFIPSARAYTIPAQSIPTQALSVGYRQDVGEQSWFQNVTRSSRFEITGVNLSPGSLSITVMNTGNTVLVFRMAAVTSVASLQGGSVPSSLATLAAISEIFIVQSNATLLPITSTDRMEIGSMVAAGGYELPPQASVTFTYSGKIQIGIMRLSTQQPQLIIPGDRYLVTVMADGFLSHSLVVAQSG